MGKDKLTKQPEIIAAIISVIGTIAGTLLISILLGFLEGRIGVGTVAGVIIFLLVVAIWVLLAIRWGVRVAGAAAAVMVIVGSVLFLIVAAARLIPFGVSRATPVAVAPSPTPQPMATSTSASIPTSLPTVLLSSSADEARAFADPILVAIAGRPPDLDDDFSDPGSGWEIRMDDAGEMGYKEGEYFVISRGPDAGDWAGTPEFSDFVLEVDVRFVSGETGSWMVIFRNWEGSLDKPTPGFYGIYGSPSGDLFLRKFISGDPAEDLLTPEPVLKPGYETNHLMVMAKGHQIALYVNGEPGGLGYDDSLSRGTIGLTAGTDSGTPLEVHFDNLKVWDISDLSLAAPRPTEAISTPTGLGRIVYHDDWTGNNEIYVANSDGSGEQRLTDHPAEDFFPAWSPDGKKIVFGSRRDGVPAPDGSFTSSIYIMDADGSHLTRLTDIESNDKLPTWSPDGSRIAFHTGYLVVINADGSNPVRVIGRRDDLGVDVPCWSPDSRRIAFKSRMPAEGPCPCQHDIYVVNDDGSGLLKLASFTSEKDGTPEDYVVWSPDGSQVAFEIYLDGRPRYYTVNSDGSGEPVEVESIPQSWYPWYYPQWQGQ